MTRSTQRIVGSLALLAATMCGTPWLQARAAPAGKMSVWPAPGADRITRTQEVSGAIAIKLAAAGNEYETFQVVVRAEDGAVKGINASVSDLVCKKTGARIARESVKLFREYYLYVLQVSGGYAWLPRIEYPDPLLPFDDPYSEKGEPYGAPFDNTRIGSAAKPFRTDAQAGPAGLFAEGCYTGNKDRDYVIQIETNGNAGATTFRWSDNRTEGLDKGVKVKQWNKEGVLIPRFEENKRTLPVPLNDGVAVRFCYGKPANTNQPEFVAGHTFHFRTYKAMNEVIWGEVQVKAGTPAGFYEGTVTVTAEGGNPVAIPIEMTVWPFSLPQERTIATGFAGGMAIPGSTNAGWLYELMLHEHRMDIQQIPAGDGASPFAAMDKEYKWKQYDAAVGGRLDGSIYPDGVGMKMFCASAHVPGNPWAWDTFLSKNPEQLKRYARELAAHLKAKGWFNRVYVYCDDEPWGERDTNIARDIGFYLEGDPGWRGKFMVTHHPAVFDSVMGRQIDIWCMKYNAGLDRKTKRYLREKKKTIWTYTANTPNSPHPTFHIDTIRGYEPRVTMWASWLLSSEGFIYWAMHLGGAFPNPWFTAMNTYEACGDAMFVYAGARGDNTTPLRPIMGPLSSFRVKQIREGFEDWELLRLAEKTRGRGLVKEIARDKVYRDAGPGYGTYCTPEELHRSWTQKGGEDLAAARELLAAAIMQGGEAQSQTMLRPDLSAQLLEYAFKAQVAALWTDLEMDTTDNLAVGVGQPIRLELPKRNATEQSVEERMEWQLPASGWWKAEPTNLVVTLPPGGRKTARFELAFVGKSGDDLYPAPVLRSSVKLGDRQVLEKSVALPVDLAEFFLKNPRTTPCARLANPPKLDGIIAADEWGACAVATRFVSPSGLQPSAYATEARLGWDRENLYVAYRCHEPDTNNPAVARVAEKDGFNIWDDDCVEIFIDADLDRKSYCQVLANADGVVFDALIPDHETRDGSSEQKWDSGATVKTGREAGAWTLEMAIPWKAFGIDGPPKAGTRFGLQLARTRAARTGPQGPEGQEMSQWSPTFSGSHHRPERFGVLTLAE